MFPRCVHTALIVSLYPLSSRPLELCVPAFRCHSRQVSCLPCFPSFSFFCIFDFTRYSSDAASLSSPLILWALQLDPALPAAQPYFPLFSFSLHSVQAWTLSNQFLGLFCTLMFIRCLTVGKNEIEVNENLNKPLKKSNNTAVLVSVWACSTVWWAFLKTNEMHCQWHMLINLSSLY